MHPTQTPAGQARYAELNRKTKGALASLARNPTPNTRSLTPLSELTGWSKHDLIVKIMRAEDDWAAAQAGYVKVLGVRIQKGNDIWGFGVITQGAIDRERPGEVTVTNGVGRSTTVYADEKYWVLATPGE